MNQQSLSLLAIVLTIVLLFLGGLLIGLFLGKRHGRLEAEKRLPEQLQAERSDALKRSRATLGGQVAEQLAPYLPNFPCDPQDARFVGKPVDFVAFSGASNGQVDEIVFVEVKTGNAGLSKVERSVRDAIVAGKVRWVEYRIPLEAPPD
jgi:predicted Holliday junction resolvase-like endonuclease